MKSLKHKCYVMNSFPILFGRQSRHIGRTLFRAWTVTSGDWSTSWPSVTDVRLRVTIMNPAKTWWPQLTSMQCFYCIQEKGLTWFLCMLHFVWKLCEIFVSKSHSGFCMKFMHVTFRLFLMQRIRMKFVQISNEIHVSLFCLCSNFVTDYN